MPSTQPAPQFAANLSTDPRTFYALSTACDAALDDLRAGVDLALLFVSHHHQPRFDELADAVCDRLGVETVLGCTGESIVGNGQEIEDEPAIALWLAHLPATTVQPMHLSFARTSEGGSFVGWPDSLAGDWPTDTTLLLLGEPFSFPADGLLERLNEDRPGVQVIGGMASGAPAPGGNRLYCGRRTLSEGAVAVAIHGAASSRNATSGGVRIRSVVSQGCRPIGRPFVVTKAERNVIFELGGKPPLAIVNELYATLSPAEQKIMQSGLHVGRVMNEYQSEFRRGDFLVRNLIGADRGSGAIAINDFIRSGQTIQFHLRDAATADEDLRELLGVVANEKNPSTSNRGALLFTCNGRGTRLFAAPHHDASVIQTLLPNTPTAGFFAQGEIGPVGRQNFLHGFTASLALFEAAD